MSCTAWSLSRSLGKPLCLVQEKEAIRFWRYTTDGVHFSGRFISSEFATFVLNVELYENNNNTILNPLIGYWFPPLLHEDTKFSLQLGKAFAFEKMCAFKCDGQICCEVEDWKMSYAAFSAWFMCIVGTSKHSAWLFGKRLQTAPCFSLNLWNWSFKEQHGVVYKGSLKFLSQTALCCSLNL